MIPTGEVESWTQNPIDLGPIYPFVGWEMFMFLVCLAICIALAIWKITSESAHYASQVRQLKESSELERILAPKPPGTDSETGAEDDD